MRNSATAPDSLAAWMSSARRRDGSARKTRPSPPSPTPPKRSWRKRYFTGSILLFTFASVMSGLSGSLGALAFWQIVSGFGGGALIATGQAILFESFPPEEKTVAAAIFGLGMMAGPGLGPTCGSSS